jgi:hypothetical protein
MSPPDQEQILNLAAWAGVVGVRGTSRGRDSPEGYGTTHP